MHVLWITIFLASTVFIMVYKCAAFGCKSGSKSNTDDSCVTFYAFPSDPQLREKWIKANPRKDFVVTKHSRLCSLHFHSSDFVDVCTDTNKSRAQQKSDTALRRILKHGVVPSVFHNAPAYLSKSPGTRRGTKKTVASSRRADKARKLQELEESFVADDDISTLSHSEILECSV